MVEGSSMFFILFLQVIIEAEFLSSTLEAKDHLNMTSLHYSSKNGHLDIVKFLISKNVNINPAALQEPKRSYKSELIFLTPLDMAIASNHNDIVQLLEAKGILKYYKQ